MKSHGLIVCLILMVGHLTSVQAVSDAELEALEKQIEQLESDEKKQAEAAEKRKIEAAAKRKAEADAEKKRLIEFEQKRIREEKRKKEEARLAELEQQRQEEETKKEKYNLLIAEAEQAVSNKDKELAINKYNEALTLYPGDTAANTGMKEAEKLMDKMCYEILGDWTVFGGNMNIKTDGTMTMDNHEGTWKCLDPEAHTYFINVPYYSLAPSWEAVLKEGGRCLTSNFPGLCWRRPGSKNEDGNTKKSKQQFP
jgi:hypothetical protein